MEKLLCILRSANYYNVNYIYENIHFFALKKKQKHPLYNAFSAKSFAGRAAVLPRWWK